MIKFILVSAAILYLLSRFSTQIFSFALWVLGQKLEKEIQKQEAKNQGFATKDYQDGTIFYKKTNTENYQKNKENSADYIDYEEVK
jgi:hypothetical protein